MQIRATPLPSDIPGSQPGVAGSTASQGILTVQPPEASGRRPAGNATPQARPPIVRVIEGALVDAQLSVDSAWTAVRRSTALRGRIIPATGRYGGGDARSRKAISSYAQIGAADGHAANPGSLLNRYA
ncbi:MAG: hypothetical protein M0Z84_02050 [Gammaproteobacteria bacterium]|nr:hypothetical protein [Gammaproteobacteria bacterium]